LNFPLRHPEPVEGRRNDEKFSSKMIFPIEGAVLDGFGDVLGGLIRVHDLQGPFGLPEIIGIPDDIMPVEKI
jgi:hypothetical protein